MRGRAAACAVRPALTVVQRSPYTTTNATRKGRLAWAEEIMREVRRRYARMPTASRAMSTSGSGQGEVDGTADWTKR